MGTYAQWSKSRKIAKIVWLQGPESALVQEITNYVKSTVSASELDSVTFDASVANEAEIWDAVYSRSLTDEAPRLIQVLKADKLSNVERLEEWVKVYSKHSPETTLLMVSDTDPIHVSLKAPKATVVKCVMHKPEDKLRWTQQVGHLSEETAKRLLVHKNGNLDGVYNLCRKILTLLPDLQDIELSMETIQSLDEETPCGFSESLLEKNKEAALNSVKTVDSSSVGSVISYLDHSLTLADTLKDVLATMPKGVKLDVIPNFPMGRVQELIPVARDYTFGDMVKRHQLLMLCESYYRQGITEGLLESLTIMW
jgi:hypothetical protein